MQKPVTTEELLEAFQKFDASLDLDEEKIAQLSDKERSSLFIAIQKVLEYRKDFPPDLADAIQELAKQAVQKNPNQNQESSLSLDPDTDGIVLETGEIIRPDDELFPLAKKLSTMSSEEVEQLVDDLATVVSFSCQKVMVHLLDKRLRQIEKQRGIVKDDKQDDNDKGKWPTMTQQMN